MSINLSRQFVRFLWIGSAATAAHVAVAAHLIGNLAWSAPAGNAAAFACANLLSFLCQSLYVFDARPTPVRYGRFLGVSLVCLGAVAAVSWALEALGVHYLAAIAAVVLMVPFATFCVHSVWTFRSGESRASPHQAAS
jgi:putative flippase GtrA